MSNINISALIHKSAKKFSLESLTTKNESTVDISLSSISKNSSFIMNDTANSLILSMDGNNIIEYKNTCLLYTSPSPRDV
jgi:hypothetical protein